MGLLQASLVLIVVVHETPTKVKNLNRFNVCEDPVGPSKTSWPHVQKNGYIFAMNN